MENISHLDSQIQISKNMRLSSKEFKSMIQGSIKQKKLSFKNNSMKDNKSYNLTEFEDGKMESDNNIEIINELS